MTTNRYPDDPQPGDVEISLGHTYSNQEPYHTVRLEIIETLSGQQIISVRITPEQLGILLGSSTVYAHTRFAGPRDREECRGKPGAGRRTS